MAAEIARRPATEAGRRLERTVIRPPGRWPTLGLGELWRLRAIALVIARRSLMVRYRQTLIGAAWVLIQPLTMMIVFTLFFGLMMGRAVGPLPYPAFLLVGLVVWMMTARILSQGSTSISSNAGLLSKIYFPRAYLPIGVALGALVDFGFGLLALAGLLVFYGIVPNLGIMLVPVFAAIAFAAALGVAFWLSALNARYRDIEQLLPFLSQVWFFTTPIFYSIDIIPTEWRALLWLNPMALAVEGFRWAFLGTALPPAAFWVVGTLVALALFASGYTFFRSREPTFADVV